MNIEINGEIMSIAENASLSEALDQAGINTTGVAIAVNENVVRKTDYDSHSLNDGDKVLIIKVFYGG